jgi:hypothetical protein
MAGLERSIKQRERQGWANTVEKLTRTKIHATLNQD